MEDSPCSRACDKSRPVSGRVAYELFRHLVCPLIIGDVTEDEPAKRDQLDETNWTLNRGVTEPDVPLHTVANAWTVSGVHVQRKNRIDYVLIEPPSSACTMLAVLKHRLLNLKVAG